MAARSTRVILTNSTGSTLTKVDGSDTLDHGEWTDPWRPPQAIAPGATAEWRSESAGIATGTEGSVKYQIGDANSLFIHWDNPFVGSNSYQEVVDDGFELFHTGGDGGDATASFTLATSVPHRVSGFLPSTSGFRFDNAFPSVPLRHLDFTVPDGFLGGGSGGNSSLAIGDASNGLCGGMVYAVRDYFEAGQRPPDDADPPSGEGDPLFDYIVDRLFDSFDIPGGVLTYLKLMNPLYPDTDAGIGSGRAWVMARDEWSKIKADIDSGHPSPIGLIKVKSLDPTDLGKNHQVLVYGYDLSGTNLTLHLYDPNRHGDDGVTLALNLQFTDRPMTVTCSSPDVGPVLCFFRTNYSAKAPVRGVALGSS